MPHKTKTALAAGTPGGVIIVTDSGPFLQTVLNTLTPKAQDLHTASNGAEAVHTLKTHPVQLLILDAQLQNPPAEDLLLKLRTDPHNDSIRIVFCTQNRNIQSFEPFLLEHDLVFDSL